MCHALTDGGSTNETFVLFAVLPREEDITFRLFTWLRRPKVRSLVPVALRLRTLTREKVPWSWRL